MYIIYGLNSLAMTEHIYRKYVGVRTNDLYIYMLSITLIN